MQINSIPASDKLRQIYQMKNPIQNYAWGSRTAIAELLGHKHTSEQPQAEIWMGAHSRAPSKIWYQRGWHRLDHMIDDHPNTLIGSVAAQQFSGQLPFLLKILAVAEPLSIQAHPNAAQARAGYEKENRLNIAPNADDRNYKDDRHKPECMCALTHFWGLCGFRSAEQMVSLLDAVWSNTASSALGLLEKKGIDAFFAHIMRLPSDKRVALISSVVDKARLIVEQDEAYAWLLRLNDYYPGNIGVLSPLLLNLIHLNPGQAIFLPAGQLHAYLEGVGVELMASSDNVLRGGLTPKHVDVPELLKILDFNPHSPELLEPMPTDTVEKIYPSPIDEFRLSVIEMEHGESYAADEPALGPEILLCTRSVSAIECRSNEQTLTLQSGQSLFVASGVDGYTLKGEGTVYRAMMNIHSKG